MHDVSKYRRDTGWLFDHDLQKTTWFSGLPGLWVQDAACQSGVAAIYDRTQENLSTTDTGIVVARRLLLNSIARYRDQGIRPAGADDPATFMARAVSLHLPTEAVWSEAGAEHMRAELGKDFGYAP